MRILGFQFPDLRLYKGVTFGPGDAMDEDKNGKSKTSNGVLTIGRLEKRHTPLVLATTVQLDAIKFVSSEIWPELQAEANKQKLITPNAVTLTTKSKSRKIIKEPKKSQNTFANDQKTIKEKEKAQLLIEQNLKKEEQKKAEMQKKISDSFLEMDPVIPTLVNGKQGKECVGYMLAVFEYDDVIHNVQAKEYLSSYAENVKFLTSSKRFESHFVKSIESTLKESERKGGQIHAEMLLIHVLDAFISEVSKFSGSTLVFKGQEFGPDAIPHGSKKSAKDDRGKEEKEQDTPSLAYRKVPFSLKHCKLHVKIRYFGDQTKVCPGCLGAIEAFEETWAKKLKALHVDAERVK
jgi:hypothetical protein